MRGVIPPIPQYAFMAWCSVKVIMYEMSLHEPVFLDIISPAEDRKLPEVIPASLPLTIPFPLNLRMRERLVKC
jgi:hypothetical protein